MKNILSKPLWQSTLWENYQKALGRKVWRIEKSGVTALVVRQPQPFGKCILEISRGPIFETDIDPLFWDEIKKLARKENAMAIRFSPVKEIKNLPFKTTPDPDHHHPEATLILDLFLTDEELLAQMKPKGRYNIRLAEKHGVQIQESTDVKAFHSLLLKTGSRDGFGIHPAPVYQKMLESLKGHAVLYLAELDGKVIAGGLFVFFEETAIYYYGASDHDYRNLMAPYLVQWHAIREAKKRGCKIYDFLGITPTDDPSHPWAKVTDFKKKFGGTEIHYPKSLDWVLQPFWYGLIRIVRIMKRKLR